MVVRARRGEGSPASKGHSPPQVLVVPAAEEILGLAVDVRRGRLQVDAVLFAHQLLEGLGRGQGAASHLLARDAQLGGQNKFASHALAIFSALSAPTLNLCLHMSCVKSMTHKVEQEGEFSHEVKQVKGLHVKQGSSTKSKKTKVLAGFHAGVPEVLAA